MLVVAVAALADPAASDEERAFSAGGLGRSRSEAMSMPVPPSSRTALT